MTGVCSTGSASGPGDDPTASVPAPGFRPDSAVPESERLLVPPVPPPAPLPLPLLLFLLPLRCRCRCRCRAALSSFVFWVMAVALLVLSICVSFRASNGFEAVRRMAVVSFGGKCSRKNYHFGIRYGQINAASSEVQGRTFLGVLFPRAG